MLNALSGSNTTTINHNKLVFKAHLFFKTGILFNSYLVSPKRKEVKFLIFDLWIKLFNRIYVPLSWTAYIISFFEHLILPKPIIQCYGVILSKVTKGDSILPYKVGLY